MELLVLSTLDWRMSALTPFSYYMHKLGFDDLWRKEMQAERHLFSGLSTICCCSGSSAFCAGAMELILNYNFFALEPWS